MGGETDAAIAISGVTEKVLAAAAAALTKVFENAFETVFLVTLSWGLISCIAAWFTPSIEDLYTDEVMRQLRDGFGGDQDGPGHVVPDALPMPAYEPKGHVWETRSQKSHA